MPRSLILLASLPWLLHGIRITNSIHGECDVTLTSSGLACWMGGTRFSLRFFQDAAANDLPSLHVGWAGGRSAYNYLIERSAVESMGKWCYNIYVDAYEGLYGEIVQVTKEGDVYSNAHAGRCSLPSLPSARNASSCCTLQTVEYCIHKTGSPMQWGGQYISASWGTGSYKVALVPRADGSSVAGIGCIGCGGPKNETTCVGQWK